MCFNEESFPQRSDSFIYTKKGKKTNSFSIIMSYMKNAVTRRQTRNKILASSYIVGSEL